MLRQPCLLAALEALLLGLLLHPALAGPTRALLERIGDASRPAHAWLLGLLLRGQPAAEAAPEHSLAFYVLFAHAVTTLPTPTEACCLFVPLFVSEVVSIR